ncbi:kinesin protein [Salix suchowensis]|nr:kinesin protein [Salix suchowensis]
MVSNVPLSTPGKDLVLFAIENCLLSVEAPPKDGLPHVEVYEEGAKNVALSALTGINATIFAYGQTSSGKTYTMRGITENAVTDIFEHIKNTQERAFVLKVSALEIYNESVIDLLNHEFGHLRLLNDPEGSSWFLENRGIIVEKLDEEVVKDINHLRHLIGICEGFGRGLLSPSASFITDLISTAVGFAPFYLHVLFNFNTSLKPSNGLHYIMLWNPLSLDFIATQLLIQEHVLFKYSRS